MSLIELADYLKNVSEACRVMGVSGKTLSGLNADADLRRQFASDFGEADGSAVCRADSSLAENNNLLGDTVNSYTVQDN